MEISVIIPTHNSAAKIGMTLDSLLAQKRCTLDIIIVDANSTDRTLEIIQMMHDDRIRLFSVASFNRYAMFNFAIPRANGCYLNFMIPGDIYISPLTSSWIEDLSKGEPDLLMGGSLLRDGRTEVKTFFRSLSRKLLEEGKQPTALEAIWFHKRLFSEFALFDTSLEMRGAFEFLCRIYQKREPTFSETSRVVADYDLRFVTQKTLIRHFWETMRIVYRYFGVKKTAHWLCKQRDLNRFSQVWKKSIRACFYTSTE